MGLIWEQVKKYIYGAGAGVIALLGAVAYYWFGKAQDLERSNASIKTEAELAKVLTLKEVSKEEADSAEKMYNEARDKFLAAQSDSDGPNPKSNR